MDFTEGVPDSEPAVSAETRTMAPNTKPAPASLSKEDVEGGVLRLVNRAVGAEVGRTMPLMSAGLDSLASVDLIALIKDELGVELPVTALYEHPTVEQLALAVHSVLVSTMSSPPEQRGTTAIIPSNKTVPPTQQPLPTPRPPPPARNPEAPTLDDKNYFCVPSIQVLERLSMEQLASIPRFIVGHKQHGEFYFLQPVDLQRANLSRMIRMDKGKARLVPYLPDGSIAPEGKGLNQPCILTLKGLGSADLSPAAVAAFKTKLAAAAKGMGAEFMDYYPASQQWIVRLPGFKAPRES